MAKDPAAHALEEVQHYWEQMNPLYLETMTTFQAGLVKGKADADPFRANNLYVAARTRIRSGQRILDAGCGVCGPSIDIARAIDDVTIEAITLSPVQVDVARQYVRQAGLDERITVQLGDYHHLPFTDDSFECVLFLESFSYSPDPHLALTEACRVLRPGGILYIKDVFCSKPPLSVNAQRELMEFNRIYCSRPLPMAAVAAMLAELSFQRIQRRNLSQVVSTDHVTRAMVETRYGIPILTEFGKIHFRPFRTLPILFGEIFARRSGC